VQISDELKQKVNAAQKVCVLTGAGISAESGVPTFRGGGGAAVWKGMPFDEISSARMVRENLPEVWEWFDYRRGIFKDCKPNPAHHALMMWESRVPDLLIVTQNIDGLHRAAGSSRIIELHGNIQRSRCPKCGLKYEMLGEQLPHDPDICDLCDTPVRPDVVLFGEMLPDGAFEMAEQTAGECELFVSIGTSALVFPAAALSSIAKQAGAFCLEINPEETPQSHFFDASLRGKAGEILPELLGINTAEMRV
jgi:NAD-dependent deacetylase